MLHCETVSATQSSDRVPDCPHISVFILSFIIDCALMWQDLYSVHCDALCTSHAASFLTWFLWKNFPPKKQTQMRWDKKKKFLLRNPTGEHLTRSSNAAAVLNVTPRDTAGRQQMERAHWGALVVICSYSWRWRGPGETNTSVVPWCYIKLLLSLTEPRTRWTGAAGVSRLQLGSAEPQKWALGISKSKAARGKQAGWTIHGHGESVLNI